jgi:hypothetical protein
LDDRDLLVEKSKPPLSASPNPSLRVGCGEPSPSCAIEGTLAQLDPDVA